MRIRKGAIALACAVAAASTAMVSVQVEAGAATAKPAAIRPQKSIVTDWSHCLESPLESTYEPEVPVLFNQKFKVAQIGLPVQRACSLRRIKDVTFYRADGTVRKHKQRTTWMGLYFDTPNAQGNVNQFECTINPALGIVDGHSEITNVTTQRLQRTQWQTTAWCLLKGKLEVEFEHVKIPVPFSRAFKMTRTVFGTNRIYMVTTVQQCAWDKTNCGGEQMFDYRTKDDQGNLWIDLEGSFLVPLFGPNGKPPLP